MCRTAVAAMTSSQAEEQTACGPASSRVLGSGGPFVATQRSTARWIPPAILVAVFLVATIALHRSVIGRDQYDDSYITYRYAANLATGKGLVFNSYERINSASSFLYTIVLAGAYRIGLHDLELFASLFGLAMGSLLVVVTFLMARKQMGGRANRKQRVGRC